ncbi:chitin synthase [Pilobolus umbonatus]|nr:chitin synthase [Pilobolus umbonatus]
MDEIRNTGRINRRSSYHTHTRSFSRDHTHGSTLPTRSKSLNRPERRRPRQSMIKKALPIRSNVEANNRQTQAMPRHLQEQITNYGYHLDKVESDDNTTVVEPSELSSWWAWTAYLLTCCFPSCFIRICFHKTNKNMQQAWREKMALFILILGFCGILTYIVYGLGATLCPGNEETYPYSIMNNGVREIVKRDDVSVFGELYSLDTMQKFLKTQQIDLTSDFRGEDLSTLFDGDTSHACDSYKLDRFDPTLPSCSASGANGKGALLVLPEGKCIPLETLHSYERSHKIMTYEWEDINVNGTKLALLGNTVADFSKYLDQPQMNTVYGTEVGKAIRNNLGNEMTYSLYYSEEGKKAYQCLKARYGVGIGSSATAGCISVELILGTMFGVVLCIIGIRYSMACLFHWFIKNRLVKPGGRSNWLAWRSIRGGNDDPANHQPGPYNNYKLTPPSPSSDRPANMSYNSSIVNTELYTVMLVTCYSENEDSLRVTMDSLSDTTYSDKHKILFVIADGLITGEGETRSTPDILIDMMDLTPAMDDPKSCSYVAVADGEKQLNMAKVYAGHYKNTPCIAVVKCGTDEEQNGPKPGNRGKRDSQVILMTFFQRVLFNDRFSELDYDIFWKMTWLMNGVTPDKFEVVLMVDADTKVLPDSLTYMVAAMANDITIMGLCGETRIANKRASWVTAIQVFEYYISHHYAKAFESLFGIVTCLPGCFSMYRIKSPKHGLWIPILANPDVIMEYNQNVVTTLHEKNLLLLGEDRFLSTLMLRTFPKRQMMFVPQARCRTIVPDEFKVLLSQRRRWINSTVHNLMELVMVSDLCGIGCFSMQFSVFIDLLGTLVLPVAVPMTIFLIVQSATSSSPQWDSVGLLIAVLTLPALLIGITSFNLVYILWMFIYIIALPIWNTILPLYSYWHFDDFSWGATRVVAGEKKGDSHGDSSGTFDYSRLIMKHWKDWERERLRVY